jgi:phosphatidylserine/phosphatidylglycerophosphate/cardiolipin synthase-like enzyme
MSTATATLLTDTLPAAVEFVAQTSPFTVSSLGGVLCWDLGNVLAGTQVVITVTVEVTDTAAGLLTNHISATTTASETTTSNNTDSWTTIVGEATVLISAVLYDGYQSGDMDEAVQLVNVGAVPVDLTGWELCKDTGTGLGCHVLPPTVLSPSSRIWLARDAVSFTVSFGFPPDFEMDDWLPYGLSNSGDEVVLRDGEGVVVDAVVFEGGNTAVGGWSGGAVEPYSVGRAEGQILYRIPDETTGLPVADTDTAADWIQYTGDATYGRRVLYPGWDLDPLFWPMTATESAVIVVGIAPDNSFDVLSQTIGRAQRTISVEVYSLRHPMVVTALVQKAQEGVSVTVLLEGQQALVGREDPDWQQELWACREIEAVGGQCWFMIHDTGERIYNRYDYIHAKFIIVDGKWVLITSQNLTESGFPSDDKSNGTAGSRGVVLATNASSMVARAAQVFALDTDAAHHTDLLRWSSALTGTYGPPVITYTPQLTMPDYTTTTVHFEAPLEISGAYDFELFTAPEAALRQSDALLGPIGRASTGDAIYVEQLYEYVDWGDSPAEDPNLRLEAYIAAARRGATVRILLNRGTFGGPQFGTPNTATVAYVNQVARDEDLDLQAALADPTQYGIHNKMVLVWLGGEGGYIHVGSINGSEGSSKINREMAIQVQSDEAYAYLKEMFDLDWKWSQPIYLPLVMQRYTSPANYLLITEVDYSGSCEWVEIYNPTALTITLTGYKIGDAESASKYEGMYIFPARQMAPGEVIIVAGDATEDCNPAFMMVDYEMYGTNPSVPNLVRDPHWGKPGWEFALSGAGDEVLLLNPSNQPVDVVVYGNGHYPGVTPHPLLADWRDTLERIPANVDTNDCSYDFEPGGSPGWVQ